MSTSVEIFSFEQPFERDQKPHISRIEFVSVKDDLSINFYDSSLMEKDDYSVIDIDADQLISLRDWIDYQINKKKLSSFINPQPQ